MSAHPKRRCSATVKDVETVPNIKQQRFTPQNKTVSIRKQSLSTPRTRQETLTQMGAIHYMPPSYDEGELDLLDKNEQPPSSKRRKTKSKAVFKSAGPEKTATKEEDANGSAYEQSVVPVDCQPRRKSRRLEDRRVIDNHIGQPGQEDCVVKFEAKAAKSDVMREFGVRKARPRLLEELMPPPRTPHSTRRKEVPSSQSPPVTPLSTQSRRSPRGISRSPLKERSTNVTLQLSSPCFRKTAHWRPLLEVADSMDSEIEDSKVSTQARGLRTVLVPRSTPSLALSSVPNDRNNDPLIRDLNRLEPSNDLDTYQKRQDIDPTNTNVENSETGVCVSECESGGDRFVFGLGTQASLNSIVSSSHLKDTSIPTTIKHEQITNDRLSRSSPLAAAPKAPFDVHRDNIDSFCGNDHPMPTKPVNQNKDSMNCEEPVIPSPPRVTTTNSSHSLFQPQPPTSPSEEASHHLTSSLNHTISPPHILETETQFENRWRSFTPPANSPNNSEKFDEARNPEDPDNISDDLPLPTPSRSHVPVPPSQATTVDITQASSHTRLRTQHPPTQHFSSSPPRPLIFSSSPARAKNDVSNGTWDEIRLTESQLLPESLMNDSLHAPPPYLLEDWVVGDQL